MAKNEVLANVRLTIGGVAASKKQLELLTNEAERLKTKIAEVRKQDKELRSQNADYKTLAPVVEELRQLERELKTTKTAIKNNENELNSYVNVLDNVAGTKLVHLQQALRGLQTQMKNSLTQNDVRKYTELKDAYDMVLRSVEQLSGKVPNLTYVFKNLGNVADKTLADSIGYMERLIATTDKTTKKGRENIKQWTGELKKMREEMANRSIKVLENPQHYSVEAIQQAVASLKKLQPSLKLSSDEWDNYAQKIKNAEQYLKSYDEKQKQIAEKAMRQQIDKVLANPAGFSQQDVEEAIKNAEKLQKTYTVGSPWWIHYKNGVDAAKLSLDSFNQKQKEADELARKETTKRVLSDPTATGVSEQAILDAIKHGKELQKQLEYGGDEWKKYAEKIKFAEEYLKSYDAEQRRLMETQKAQAAIQNAASAKTATGAFNLTKDEAKEAAEAIEKYINTLNMSTQADEIKAATDALNIYNEALGKVKDTTVDVNAILNDPKNFSTEQIEKGIKQLEEAGKAIAVGNTAEIQKNVDNINKLKNALADSTYDKTWLTRIVDDATEGKASIADMEKAIALIKDKMRRTTDKTVMEKLRQDLDKLNPALDATKFNLDRVEKTLGNIKGSNLGSLKEAAERLKQELNDVNMNMDDFAKKASELKQVNQQIKELESQTKNVASAWDNAVSRLKNWVLIYAGSSEIWNMMTDSYRGVLKLSDAMSDVRKTTGLTNEEVKLLTDQVQELDTRISNEKLMQSAVEAGRIGLKTRQEVFEFTRASAITLTALDELDARAITSVMKLNELLGETSRLGVQQAILSTASSINELSMASSAAQQPIIDFSRRFGGIAAQANISTAQVLALGATIDALGQPIEMSSTALNKFTTALLSNGKQIAEDTGLSEDYIFEMTRQGKTIELMIEVLSKLNNMGGIGEISKYMGDMGGDGARMTAVVSALAANLDLLGKNLDISNLSFKEGISVINEYNIKNENAAAIVERMANDIKEAIINSQWVTLITSIVKGLQELIHFMLSGSDAAKLFNTALVFLSTLMLRGVGTIGKINTALSAFIVRMKATTISIKHFQTAWMAVKTFFSNVFLRVLDLLWAGIAKAELHMDMFSKRVLVAARTGGVFSAAMKAVSLSLNGLKNAFLSLVATNPVGWFFVLATVIADLVLPTKKLEEQVDNTGSAIDRANEAFEEEAYSLTKLREKLKEAAGAGDDLKKRTSIMSEVISTLNREYSEEIGYVISLTASQEELAKAIDLVTVAKRKQALENEKNKVAQNVREEYREQTTAASNELKKSLDSYVRNAAVGGDMYSYTDKGLTDLYNAIVSDAVESARLNEVAALGERTEEALRTQAKSMSDGNAKLEEDLYKEWNNKLKTSHAVKAVLDVYTSQMKAIKEGEGDIARYIVAEDKAYLKTTQESIDLRKANALLEKEAKDFNEDDETYLAGIIKSYSRIAKIAGDNKDTDAANKALEQAKKFEMKQNEVLRAFVENPLRDIKMKVGEDGKLYKELTKDGRIQYEAVQEMSDASLEMLRKAYVRTENIAQQLISDRQGRIDSKIKEQGQRLSDVKTAIKKELAKNGWDIDDKGNVKVRDTEYRDGSASRSRQEDNEGRKAYQALLNNLKEYYDQKKQMALDDYLHGTATVEGKNRRIEEIERQHKGTMMAMMNELLGETEDMSLFDEDTLIRDKDNWVKVLGWILKDTHHFQDQVRADREALEKENLESMVKYKEERDKILLGNNYQKQVDVEMQAAFENADLFWFGMENRTTGYASSILATLRHFSKDAYSVESSELIKRLQAHSVFGDDIQKLTAEQQQALIILLQQYYDKDMEARRKHKEQAKDIVEDLWKTSGEKDEYNKAKNKLEEKAAMSGALNEIVEPSEKKAFEEKVKFLQEQMELERMAYQFKIDNVKNEEARLEYQQELAEKERAIQIALTEAYIEEYNRRAEKISEHAREFGEFAGVMASAAWNSVEDRKRAGEELLRYIAQETTEYLREWAIRKVKEGIIRRQGLVELKKGEEEKHDIEQKGVDTSTQIAEMGGKALIDIEKFTTGTVGQMAESGAEQSATTAVKEAAVKGQAGILAGSAKTIGELGWWGIPLVAVIEGVISMLLSMATSALSSQFGKSTDKTTSSKRLATGMLTYASGRYPTLGDDGRTYNAQYEPTLRTGIYDGGKGKAHMALFSEVMPEMVVSGRTTKIIREDFPGLMNAIMMIDKYGTLPQPRRVRRYADGNVDDFDVEMVQNEDGSYSESPAIRELRQSNQELREAVVVLTEKLSNPIPVFVNMYGPGGIYESMDKANKFYQKNRIKNS